MAGKKSSMKAAKIAKPSKVREELHTAPRLETGPDSSSPTLDQGRQVSAKRPVLQESFGRVTLALLEAPRYKQLPIADLTSLVLDPLIRNRIAIAYATPTARASGMGVAGVAIWASVSPEVDAKINEQMNKGVFPVRLKPEDWNSGSIHWLLGIIAPAPHIASKMLMNFQQVAKGNTVKVHPIIGTLVDVKTLWEMSTAKNLAAKHSISIN